MTTFPDSRPPLRCRMVRGWISLASSGNDRASRSAHVAHCADCQQFYADSDSLESALRHEAIRGRPPAPLGLDQRIMAEIRSGALPEKKPNLRPAFVFAGLAAAVALTIVALPTLNPPAVEPLSAINATSSTISPEENIGGNESWFSTERVTDVLLEREPLRQEANAIYGDARRALRFLEANFAVSMQSPERENGSG